MIDGSWGGVIEAGSVGFVEVEHGQVGESGGRGDQQVGDGQRSVVTALRGPVDEPVTHDQAPDITSGSSRSAASEATRSRCSTVTGPALPAFTFERSP